MESRDSFDDFYSIKKRLDTFFGQDSDSCDNTSFWRPAMDVYETASTFVVKIELPELDENDISVRVEKGLLKISGERKKKPAAKSCIQIERPYGPFLRQFRLPASVDDERINAELRDGILTVAIPKKSCDTPVSLKIN
ncbi:MAG: Hsp20/alpha crystallin family protein [Nitrospirae bacterium]|nr:Hsp20/alpha crystallin family protein [Nitrospirota bacterium]